MVTDVTVARLRLRLLQNWEKDRGKINIIIFENENEILVI